MDQPWLHDLGVATQLLGWRIRRSQLKQTKPILGGASLCSLPHGSTAVRNEMASLLGEPVTERVIGSQHP